MGKVSRQHGISQALLPHSLTPSYLCSVNNIADLAWLCSSWSTVPAHPLDHGPLLFLVYQCYLRSPGCCCPERINMCAVPTAPRVFFQLPQSHLIYLGFSDMQAPRHKGTACFFQPGQNFRAFCYKVSIQGICK